MALAPLDGDPSVVEGHGTTYKNTAKAITEAVDLLRQIRNEDTTVSKAVDRVRDDAGDVSADIELATERYEVTGVALVDYAGELLAAQRAADEAIEEWESAKQLLESAQDAKDRAEAAAEEDTPDLSQHTATIRGYESAMQTAETNWHNAEQRKNEAAEHAAALINDIISDAEINDSWWDNVKGFFSDAWDWLGDALAEIFKFIAQLALTIGLILVGVALIVAWLGGGWLLFALAGFAIATFALTGGAAEFIDTLFKTGDWQRALTSGLIKQLSTLLGPIVDYLIELEKGVPDFIGKYDPNQTVDLSDMTPGEILAWFHEQNVNADKHVGSDLDGFHNENSSMITVTEIVGPDGEVRYVVNIPSTQVWLPGGTALNDITAGIVGKLGDERTQLEQAVIDAMERAGVDPGDSVILSGWSLGGITAGNLAADSWFNSTYDVDAVVTAGSGLDDVDIPSHIPVLQFEHSGGPLYDPVTGVVDPDASWHRDDPNRTIVNVPPPDGTGFVPHEGDAYGETMQDQGDTPGSSAEQWVEDNLGGYFGEDATGTPGNYVYQRGGQPAPPIH